PCTAQSCEYEQRLIKCRQFCRRNMTAKEYAEINGNGDDEPDHVLKSVYRNSFIIGKNISKKSRRRFVLASRTVALRMIDRRRGGFCYERYPHKEQSGHVNFYEN